MKKLIFSMVCVASVFASNLDYGNQNDWEFVTGKRQSPINIDTMNVKTEKSYSKIKNYFDNNFMGSIENNGHSINVTAKGKSILNHREFELKGFHFHSPSEHKIDNNSYPLEIHFVHQQANGEFAVIGVFAKLGDANAEFQKVLDNIGGTQKINLKKLMPKNKSYYSYLGSLTTPPLTEAVEWYVIKEPITISSEQLKKFNELYDGNNRKVQDINGRNILLVK